MPRGFCTSCYPEFAGPGDRVRPPPPAPPGPGAHAPAGADAASAPGAPAGPARRAWVVAGATLLVLALLGAGVGTYLLMATDAPYEPRTHHLMARDIGREVVETTDPPRFEFQNWSAGDTVILEGMVASTHRTNRGLQVVLDGLPFILVDAGNENFPRGTPLQITLTVEDRHVPYYDVSGHKALRYVEWFKEDRGTGPEDPLLLPMSVVTRL